MNTSSLQNKEFEFFRQRPDGDIDPAGEAGWFLQREREERHITLEDVSDAIKIHAFHLEAIEQGDLTGLPPRADALEMIAVYAEYLGFDPDPLVFHFGQFLPKQPMPGHHTMPGHALLNDGDSKVEKKRPAPLSSAKILQFPVMERLKALSSGLGTSGAGGIVATCLGAVMLFGAASFVFMPNGDVLNSASSNQMAQTDGKQKVAAVSNTSEQPLPESNKVANALNSAADRSANGLTGLDALIAKSADTGQIHTASVPTGKPKKIAVVGQSVTDSSGDRVFGKENKNARLILKANANVWVRIEDAKGNVVMTRTLLSGDSYHVPDRKGLVVIARDGGLLSYSLDGAKKGNLGNKGEILVGRPLDISKLKAKKG